MRYARILWRQWRSSFSKLAIFRASALIGVVYSAVYLVANVLAVEIYFRDITSLAGWSKTEMFVLLGTFQLISGLGETFFIWAQDALPGEIVEGGLDFHLLRPVHPLFLLSSRDLYLPGLLNLPIPLFLIGYGFVQSGWTLTFGAFFGFLVAVLFGVLFYFLLNQLIVNLAFWIENASNVSLLSDEVFKFGSRPKGIYARPFQIAFGFVMPVITVLNFPSEILRGQFSFVDLAIVLAGLSALALLLRWQWRVGLRRYLGSGS